MTVHDNPNFRFVDRAPYELRRLMRQLPPDLSPYQPVTDEHRLIAEAAHTHASNAADTITCGLEALGHILSVAALSKDHDVESRHLARIGELIQHLAVDLQAIAEVEFTITDALTADDKRRATGGIGKERNHG